MQSNNKTYNKPQLVVHGNVEEITLGGHERDVEWKEKYKNGPHSGGFKEHDDD